MRLLCVLLTTSVLAWPNFAAADDKPSFATIDLQSKANQDLAQDFHGTFGDNHLEVLGQGEQMLDEVKFKVGEKFLHLGSTQLPDAPKSVEGVEIGRAFQTLHILHGTGWGAYGGPGHPYYVADGTQIGHYLVHYEDKSNETIPIIYGEDVRDWWNWDQSKEAKRGKVAWTGQNNPSAMYEVKLRLYHSEWKNPRPDVKVMRIDFVSTKNTAAAPFCIAMTTEP